MTSSAAALSGKGHRDENFPVASWLVGTEYRRPILAFYRFARAADDIADHPTLEAEQSGSEARHVMWSSPWTSRTKRPTGMAESWQ